MRNVVMTPVAYALGGMVIGGTGTYFIVKSRLKSQYEEQTNKEIAEIKEHYRGAADEEIEKAKENYAFVKGTPEEATRIWLKRMDEVQARVNYKGQVSDMGYGESPLNEDIPAPPIDDAEELMIVAEEANTTPDDQFVKDEVVAAKEILKEDLENPEQPYIISVDEFFQDEPDFEKLTITYYEKDDTLVDERNRPIPDVDGTIASRSLERFGDRSKDANVVYVRNRRLECDFEVVLDKNSYVQSVLGVDEDDVRKKTKRMREDD